MHVTRARNVCDALTQGMEYLMVEGIRENSRAGPVRVSSVPVTTMYTLPRQRVLFSSVRDANPFFHMYEAVWMLAGRSDAASLSRFVTNFGESFAESASGRPNSESGGDIHDAYGRRWRHAFGIDQLQAVVDILKSDPTSRQCVIQMWDCSPDFQDVYHGNGDVRSEPVGENDLLGEWKTRPCNTHAYLRVRERSVDHRKILDLTICCRSNDAIWGAHGANSVHFSVLQEYLACRIGAEVGVLYQISNNYHAYESEIDRLSRRANTQKARLWSTLHDDRYAGHSPMAVADPIFEIGDSADNDVLAAVEWVDRICETTLTGEEPVGLDETHNQWFTLTFRWAMLAHRWFRQGDMDHAERCAARIRSSDWCMACQEWLARRRR